MLAIDIFLLISVRHLWKRAALVRCECCLAEAEGNINNSEASRRLIKKLD